MTNKQKYLAIGILLLISLLINVDAQFLPQVSVDSQCCQDNSIIVTGNGKVSVQPDIAIIRVGVTVTASTSKGATQSVAVKIKQITNILVSNKISSKDYQTESISIYPQYEYPNGTQKLVGQTATQTLRITVRNIDSNGGIIGPLIDKLSSINGIQFNGISFQKEDKSEAQKIARKLAYQDAKIKATDLASLSSRKLGITLSIVDNSYTSNSLIQYDNAQNFAKVSTPTSISVGDLEVTYSVNAKFQLK